MKPLTAIAALAFVLSSCTTPPAETPAPSADGSAKGWRSAIGARLSGASEVTGLQGSAVPVLGSPALAAQWGKPRMERAADGSFRLMYMKSGELYGLVCYSLTSPVATPAAAPAWIEESPNAQGGVDTVFHSQGWRTATLMGQSVRWCQFDGGGGADFPTFTTECFSRTGADGKTGHYIIQAWSDTPEKAAALMQKAAFLPGN